ncbi:alpha/beta fold hydrolase [Allokutzneria sp. A3M-2-11 16]|uniref:thioesterase II family protein n=1 Tax=Allokutzneria sp. A3M-2-11 16 TaxID=2962043 RepID=UPI0020B73AC2|nr:alpha/beta fold hydrolase [Allokutzneria sp. A3M-2-11 16]MCP3800859.1 alpha/beta fold hydrolase [Allokutzneria sp. A3M-2-11 16]
MLELSPELSLWFRRFHQPAADAPVLVCFPHAGGSASYFFKLSEALSPDVDVLAVQYPGRQDRRAERCVDNVVALAERVVEAILPLTSRPLTFFGHSMGATVGFEVARRLEHSHGKPIERFLVSARCAPSLHRSADIHKRDDDGIIAEIARLSGTESTLLGDEELIRMVLPSIRNDYKAAETYAYHPGEPLSSPVTGFCGDSDPRVFPADLDGWAAHTTAPYTSKTFPGGHFYFGETPGPLAAEIRTRLLQPV